MTPAQALELQRLLAQYWKQKAKKKRVTKILEEIVVLLSQVHMVEFKIMMENIDEDELNS